MKIEDVENIFKQFEEDKYIALMTPLGAAKAFKDCIVQRMQHDNKEKAFKRHLHA